MSLLSAVHAHPEPLPRIKHLPAIDVLGAKLHAGTRPHPIHYLPDLNSFLEDSAMAREMRRL